MRIGDVDLDPLGRSRSTLTRQYLVNVNLGAPASRRQQIVAVTTTAASITD